MMLPTPPRTKSERKQMRPSQNTIKRLFARSGNLCAFPNCKAPLTHNDTLLGEICHIKGEKPGAARHDPNQSSADRQEYANLIILCPTHHTVIDDDEESYTVERVIGMKARHEAALPSMSEEDATRVAQLFTERSVRNVAQSGGLSAHTIHAQTIHVQTHTKEPLTLQRQMRAVENLWKIACNLKAEFADIVTADTILTNDELGLYFQGGRLPGAFAGLSIYKGHRIIVEKFDKCRVSEADAERPFVSTRLWSSFYIIRAMHGRAAYLFQESFNTKSYRDWRSDTGTDQLLRVILPGHVVDEVKTLTAFGLQTTFDYLEAQFLAEAKMRIE